ncbi:MAG TPA: alpha/beta hydrolase [Gaiellaceae bacterium]
MIALVPGLGVGQRYFDRLAALLDEELVRFDVREAVSIPERAARLANELDGPALLVANSMGCQVAAELAVRRPELVEAVVLVSPTVDPGARSARRQLGRLLGDVWYEPPSLTAIVVRDYLVSGPLTVLRQARLALEHRIEELLPRLEQPAVVVRGAHDRICPQDWAREAAGLLPRGRLLTVAGAAHAVHFSHPRELAAAVTRLRETPAAAG